MTYFRIVPFGDIIARMTEGYCLCATLGPWSVLMKWTGQGEAP